MLNQYTELFQVYDAFAEENRELHHLNWHRRRRHNGAGDMSIQASMRQSQFTRLFWSKLWLCWVSALLVLLLFIHYSTHTRNNYAPSAGNMAHIAGVNWGDDTPPTRRSTTSNNRHHRFWLRTNKRLIDSDQSSNLDLAAPYTLQKHPYTVNVAHEKQMREQYTGFDEPQPSTEQGGGSTYFLSANVEHKQTATQESGSQSSPRDVEDPESVEANSSKKSQPTVPPSYGWTPAAFPNPINNPTRCAIAYLRRYVDQHQPPGNGQMLSPQEIQQMQQNHPLRLCDPDWVLGTETLETVALAMDNFTAQFGRERHDELVLQRQEELESTPSGETPHPRWVAPWVDLGIATARRMDLTTVLRDSSYYAYEDDDDMVNDAAQLFAHGLHDSWWPGDDDDLMSAEHGILIFLSIQDRVCYISAGAAISSILPWWRLDSIVTSMKPALRDRDYGAAVLQAVEQLGKMLRAGPPSMADRLHDFCARFGVVIIFAAFTFGFGLWGEYRDRRKRFQFAEERSQLKGTDREKASLLQQGYKTRQCPICLESFQSDKALILSGGSNMEEDDEENDLRTVLSEDESTNIAASSEDSNVKTDNLDSFGIPLLGADGKRIKMLRCGHIFCESCWQSWVHSGCGNPCLCPVCRQDIGKAPRQHSSRRGEHSRRSIPLAAAPTTPANVEGAAALVAEGDTHPFVGVVGSRRRIRNTFWESHPSYDSVAQSRRSPSVGSSVPPDRTASAGLDESTQNEDSCSSSPNERQPLLPGND